MPLDRFDPLPDLPAVIRELTAQVKRLDGSSDDEAGEGAREILRAHREPSRYAGQHADHEYVRQLAAENPALAGRLREPQRSLSGRGGIAAGVKALAEGTGSAGGYLVAPEIAEEVTRLIRARSAVMRMGPRIVPVRKQLDITSMSTGASAYYTLENALIPTSEPTFAEAVLLRPKELTALVPVSDRLVRDAAESPDLEDVIRADLAEVLALRQDLAFLQGTGTGAEPLGIRNVSGTTAGPSLGANGATLTFDHLKDVVANLRAVNAPFERPGWIFHPRVLATLEKLKDGQGRYLAETDLLDFDATGGGGRLLGFQFVTTSQIPTNIVTGTSNDTSYLVFSSDWGEAWVGENESLTIELSGEASYSTDGGTTYISAFQARQTLFRATTAHDIGLRRPQLFTVLTGVRP